jgi:hypothetical protein
LSDHSLDVDGDGLTNIYEYSNGLSPNLKDSDGDGLEDKWEEDSGYSALSNESNSGAFGDLDLDYLANQTEVHAGTLKTTANTGQSLTSSLPKAGGDVSIVLIGRGAFTVSKSGERDTLND